MVRTGGGLFLTFEGIEGSGKSTQIELTRDYVEGLGHLCLVTKEPGGSPLGEVIRGLLLERVEVRIDPLAELYLIEADRAQHVAEIIRPALERGEVVICDRFTDATIAYQGYGRGLDIGLIMEMNRVATGGLVPDCTILLDCPIEVGMARVRGEDRFERQGMGFHQKVRDGYLEIARQQSGRIRVISGQGPTSQIQREIRKVINSLLAGG